MSKAIARVKEAPADVIEMVRKYVAARDRARKLRGGAKKNGRGKAKGRGRKVAR